MCSFAAAMETPLKGWEGHKHRVGGVLVTKQFFASGKFEVVMKIGSTQTFTGGPKDPTRPIGMVPAIWTYSSRYVRAEKHPADQFNPQNPMYNPHLDIRGWKSNEYWSEIDFPEFGKNQNLEKGLYNTFLNHNHQSRTYSTRAAIDGKYHTYTTIWRTHLVPLAQVTDKQVTKYANYYWVQDKSIPFASYRGNPLKRLGKDKYAVYAGKVAHHFIDGKFVGSNPTFVPSMAAQLNIGVWFPKWGGTAPWKESSISVASVKVWQYNDEGDVRGVLTKDISSNMDEQGNPVKN